MIEKEVNGQSASKLIHRRLDEQDIKERWREPAHVQPTTLL